MYFSKQDVEIIRELAKEVAEIAALPVQEEKRKLWKKLNGLKPERPMVMMDQLPWHEMDTDGELIIRSEHPFSQWLEGNLRRTLYLWKHMPVDMVVEPYVEIQKVIHGTDFGIQAKEETTSTDPRNSVVSHKFIDQLQTEDDLQKIKFPKVWYDKEATEKTLRWLMNYWTEYWTCVCKAACPIFIHGIRSACGKAWRTACMI